MGYPLGNIFFRSLKEFKEADTEKQKLENEYEQNKAAHINPKIIEVGERRTEAGVVAVMTAVAWIEQNLHTYAVHYFDVEAYKEHLGNLRLLTRQLLLPRLCQNKVIDEQHPAINALRELIAARNAIVHPKRNIMGDDPIRAIERTEKEGARFLSVCRTLDKTVEGLKSLLISK